MSGCMFDGQKFLHGDLKTLQDNCTLWWVFQFFESHHSTHYLYGKPTAVVVLCILYLSIINIYIQIKFVVKSALKMEGATAFLYKLLTPWAWTVVGLMLYKDQLVFSVVYKDIWTYSENLSVSQKRLTVVMWRELSMVSN